MAEQQWSEAKEKFEFEKGRHGFERERHYWKMEWAAVSIIGICALGCLIALIATKGSAPWAQNILSAITGAGIAFVTKRTGDSKPPPQATS